MFHSRELNNRKNKIQEHTLGVVYSDLHSNFEELLEKDNSFTIQEGDFQKWANVNSGLSVQ